MTGTVFDIKELGMHDGPGLRTTVFLKGCPLRCVWCHNPEGLEKYPELIYRESACIHCGACEKECIHEDCEKYGFGRCLHICPKGALTVSGREYTPEQLAERILFNKSIIKEGGVTFSGGEPLYQHEFLYETLLLLKGIIPRAIETSGYTSPEIFEKIIAETELVYMDVKLSDPIEHKKYTGVSNRLILENLRLLKESGRKAVIRTPLIPGINDSADELEKIRAIAYPLRHEILPFNALAGAKYKSIGKEFPYEKIKGKGE